MTADCLVLSRKRPAQLDLLLQSIDRYAAGLFSSVTILYRPDDGRYTAGYHLTRQRWPEIPGSQPRFPHLRRWLLEEDFENDIRVWFEGTSFQAEDRTVMFLCDDCVFYRPAVRPSPEELPYAYRLAGPNRWRDHPQYGASEEGYPLTVVGTSYRKSMLQPLLDFRFPNPTALEAGLASQAAAFVPEVIYGPEEACLCMINANRVSEGSNMPHMGIDPATINETYLEGNRFNLDAIDFDSVTTCLTMLELPWTR
jgi:hypothetical protein